MSYIEGFILPVPEDRKADFIAHASAAFPLFKEFGVTRHVECWEDYVEDGKLTDMRRAVKAKPGEKIVFSWLEYPSKAVRDSAYEKMMSDPRMEDMPEMPFDGQRMIYGGFEPISDLGSGHEAPYVSGSVFAVPTANKADFTAFAKKMAEIFKEYGAVRLMDAWGVDVPAGKVTDFQGAVQAKEDETVSFGWIEWPSKEANDEAWPKIMADPRLAEITMPADGSRMIFGGFTPVVNLFAKAAAQA